MSIKFTDYKGELFRVLQKRKRPMPSFVYETSGPPHRPFYIAKVLLADGAEFVGTPKGSKREADHSACHAALLDVSFTTEKHLSIADPGVFNSGYNYKGDLQIMCQRLRLMFPEYVFTKSGTDHAPQYQCFIIFNSIKTYSDMKFSSKRLSEQHAAFFVLKDISKLGQGSIFDHDGALNRSEQNKCLVDKVMSDYISARKDKIVPEVRVKFGQVEESEDDYVDHANGKNLYQLPKELKDDSSNMIKDRFKNQVVKAVMKPTIEVVKNESTKYCDEFLQMKKIVEFKYNPWSNYVKMLNRFCAMYAKTCPEYNYIFDKNRQRQGYIGTVCAVDKLYVSDVISDTVRRAYNTVAYYALKRLITLFDSDLLVKEPEIMVPDFTPTNRTFVERFSLGEELVWKIALKFVSFESLVKVMPLVSKKMNNLMMRDDFWRDHSDAAEQIAYREAVDVMSQRTNVVGYDFQLRDIVLKRIYWDYYMCRIREWAMAQSGPKYYVTLSDVAQVVECDIETSWYGSVVIKKGYRMIVSYRGGLDSRAFGDTALMKKKDDPYDVKRGVVPSKSRSIMISIPMEDELRYWVDHLSRGVGSGIECEFAPEPYNRSYMNVVMIFFPLINILLEIGCDSL